MTRILTTLLLAAAFAAPASANDVTVQEVRGEVAESREAATEAATLVAESTCGGSMMTVGAQTEMVGDAYVAQVWFLCTPAVGQ